MLLFLLLFLLLLTVGAGLFLATFDADRYRPFVVRKMSEAVGQPVQLEKISLRWRGGIAADLRGFAIGPALRVERVTALVELGPLLKKQVRADVRVEGGRWVGVNLLREVLGRLSVIPGLSERLLTGLPESYREKLKASDTLFQPIAVRVSASEGKIVTSSLQLVTDSFTLTAEGITLEKERMVPFPAQFQVDAPLSQAMIRSVEELSFLADEKGRLTLPVVVRGKLPQVNVFPDLGTVTRQLFSAKGEQLLGGLLEKVLKKND